MKKILIAVIVLIGVAIIISSSKSNIYKYQGVSMVSRVHEGEFQVYHNGDFNQNFLTGVNMGAGMPGTFPGELAISKEMYLEWFDLIYEMNADVIRVYTALMPEFYEALFEFNQTVDKPIYIMHGVWVNETDVSEIQDAYGEQNKIKTAFINDAIDLVDILHGNMTLEERPGYASGTYTADVSQYVIGWILGIEWDPNFVYMTNENNPSKKSYEGKYLKTSIESSPFEAFLTEVGDKVVEYEVDKYGFMRPLSFVNWPTTDHLEHPNEPDQKEDLVSVNMNHILPTADFYAGFFASFHVYPYYPEFLNYSLEYREFIDQRGEINPYQGYIRDLKDHLDMPVFIAEFGVPSSRGMTHENADFGFNQGYLSEQEQGELDVKLLEDIYLSDYQGAFLFTWQDEWFKRTWNTMDFDLASRRPFWSNAQTNEQQFGLLAFDPGEENSIRYVDGDISDWEGDAPIYSDSSLDLYTAFDERYVYLRVMAKDFSFNDSRLIIPIMTNPNQGNTSILGYNIIFDKPIDFYIEVQGETYAELFVDAYYDRFYYMYHESLNMLDTVPGYREKNSGIFNSIYQALSASLYLPEEGRTIPFIKHNTGLLTYGNANPYLEDYNSLADYYISGDNLEIKIPWLLLNISDPSSKMRLADFYETGWFSSETIDQIYFGASIIDEQLQTDISLFSTTWDSWDYPTYHSRLKKSYVLIKEAFGLYE